MKRHSLAATGLSMSDAQSISNLCNQRALDIDNLFSYFTRQDIFPSKFIS